MKLLDLKEHSYSTKKDILHKKWVKAFISIQRESVEKKKRK